MKATKWSSSPYVWNINQFRLKLITNNRNLLQPGLQRLTVRRLKKIIYIFSWNYTNGCMNVFTVVCGAKPFSQGMFTFGAIVCQCLGFTHPHSQSIIFFFFFFHSSEVLEKTDTCKCASLNVSSVRLGHWVLIADRIYVHGQKFVLGRLRVNIRSITVDPRSLEFPRETKMVRVSGGSR